MIILNDELMALSSDIWQWTKEGKPIDEAPDDIKEKINKYRTLHNEIRNQELKLMGCDV